MKTPNASLVTSFDIQSHDAGRETAIDNDRGDGQAVVIHPDAA